MATARALLIPWSQGEAVRDITWDTEKMDDLPGLVFGPENAEDNFVDVKTFRTHRAQLVFDDMGLFKQRTHVNERAMKLWAYLSGFRLEDFEQPLCGNFVVIGLDPNTGETEDVPSIVRHYFGEEGVDQSA